MNKKKKIIIISTSCAVIAAAIAVGMTFLGIHIHNNNNEEIYQKGLTQLINREHQAAYETFKSIPDYKDSNKKQDYAYQLYRIDEGDTNYEDMINEVVLWKGQAEVEFDSQGGQEIPSRVIEEHSDTKYVTEVASKSFEDFTGWKLTYGAYDQKNDQVSFELTATYSHHYYSISYLLDGGTIPEDAPLHYTYYSQDVHLPVASKVGYNFVGWKENSEDEPVLDFVIERGSHSDVSVTAVYAAKTIHVQFDGNGGTPSATEGDFIYLSDVSANLPTATKEHYSFREWTYKGQPINKTAFDVSEDNATLVASYDAKKYEIHYDNLDNSEIAKLPSSYSYDSPEISIPFPEKDGYVFAGWSYYTEGNEIVDDTWKIHRTIPEHSHGHYFFRANWVKYETTGNPHFLNKFVDVDATLRAKVSGIVIPTVITNINTNLLNFDLDLMDIDVRSDHSCFSVIDHMLIRHNSHNRDTLYAVPRVRFSDSICPETITLPKVHDIYDHAFEGCDMKHIVATNSLEEIGNSSFKDCQFLETFSGSNIKKISNMAFQNCYKLQGTFFNENPNITRIGEYAFYGCAELTSIEIGPMMEKVEQDAFGSIATLEEVSFYASEKADIDVDAFKSCGSIVRLNTKTASLTRALNYLPNSKTTLKEVHIEGDGQLPKSIFKDYSALETVTFEKNNMTVMSESAFEQTNAMKSVNIPSTVYKIDNNAFKNSAVKNVNFDNISNLKEIGESAFEGTQITALDLTSCKYLTIHNNAFKNCYSLETISVNVNALESLKQCFDGCTSLENITVHFPEDHYDKIALESAFFNNFNYVKNVTIVYDGANKASLELETGCFANCANLIDFSLVNCEITKVGNYCMENCVNFTNANGYLNDLKVIPQGLFAGCMNVQVTLNGTTEIGAYAFSHCRNLGEVYLPKTITYIGHEAFAFCEAPVTISVEYTEDKVKELEEVNPNPQVINPWQNWRKNCFVTITFGVSK